MSNDFLEYAHQRHFEAFVRAAAQYRCHILVRKTGHASLSYVGRRGYVGKRADLKAKTALKSVASYQLEGLVCSPQIHPSACKPGADMEWGKSKHLITIPPNGFDDAVQPKSISTPYILQTNRHHRHYGCVAWVENGLMLPRYVHGDYDLYAIVPEGKPFFPPFMSPKGMPMHATMNSPANFSLAQRVAHEDARSKHSVTDLVTSQSYEITVFLSLLIGRIEGTAAGGLMVNHGEQVNVGTIGQTYESVLAFYARPRGAMHARILNTREEHMAFYRDA